ncbi:MAG: hypothetical protein ACRETU_05595 [Steroidobacterales bacterium]
MLRRLAMPLTLAGLSAVYAGAVHADENSPWDTTLWIGPLFSQHGTAQFNAAGSIADLGTLDPAFADDPATTSIDRLSFRDIFRTGVTAGAELAYRTGSDVEPFVRVNFTRFGGKTLPVGTISSAAFTAPAPIMANYDVAHSTAFTVGARYLFADTGALHPFLSGFVGAEHLDALRADIGVAELAKRFDRETVMSGSTRLLAGVEGGLSYELSPTTDVRFAIGAEHLAARELESKFLAPLGIADIKESERRWTMPAEIGVNYRF